MLILDEPSRSEFYLSIRLVYCVIDNYHGPKFHIFIGLYVNLHIRRHGDFSRAILVNVIQTKIKHCNISAFVYHGHVFSSICWYVQQQKGGYQIEVVKEITENKG